jgi:hypothetical protein
VIRVALCTTRGDRFNPARDDDVLHRGCGGRGILLGAWCDNPAEAATFIGAERDGLQRAASRGAKRVPPAAQAVVSAVSFT